MEDFDGDRRYLQYDSFYVGDETTLYKATLSGPVEGTVGRHGFAISTDIVADEAALYQEFIVVSLINVMISRHKILTDHGMAVSTQ